MNQEWLINLYPFKVPERRKQNSPLEKAESELFDLWSSIVTVNGHDEDYEGFIEQAARLKAAVDLFGADMVWVHVHHSSVDYALNVETSERRTLELVSNLPQYGFKSSTRHLLSEDEGERAASKYMMSETFKQHAKRRVELAGYDYGQPGDVREVIKKMHSEGVRDFFVKGTFDKSGIFEFTLGETVIDRDLDDAFLNDAWYSFAHQEGQQNVFLVQEKIQMEYEYRVFVVAGEIISGAGAIMEHTPLDNTILFDPKVRRNRRAKSEIELDGWVVKELTDYAQRVATQWADEVPQMRLYTLDVARGKDGPLVIEVNSMPNSGFYASNPFPILDAISCDLGNR